MCVEVTSGTVIAAPSLEDQRAELKADLISEGLSDSQAEQVCDEVWTGEFFDWRTAKERSYEIRMTPEPDPIRNQD